MRHNDWMAAATEEYQRLNVLLQSLGVDDWHRPTDCAEWDVRQLVAHLIGAAESTASVREAIRQVRVGRKLRPDAVPIDAINALHVAERSDLSPQRLIADLTDAGARGVRARRRIRAPLRAIRMPFGPPLGVRSVGYAMDCIYTRDAWMHRIDIARAVDRDPVLTPDHDGRIVADVVHEWARAHSKPFALELTGPAGGQWSRGQGGDTVTLDAVEFCRTLAGRAPGEDLLACPVPF